MILIENNDKLEVLATFLEAKERTRCLQIGIPHMVGFIFEIGPPIFTLRP